MAKAKAKKLHVPEPAYVAVSNLARVRDIKVALYELVDSLASGGSEITPEERLHVIRCVDAWEARLAYRLGHVDADDGPKARPWPGPPPAPEVVASVARQLLIYGSSGHWPSHDPGCGCEECEEWRLAREKQFNAALRAAFAQLTK